MTAIRSDEEKRVKDVSLLTNQANDENGPRRKLPIAIVPESVGKDSQPLSKGGRIMFVEMRTYLLRPGTTASFEERFTEGLSARAQISPFGGLWRSEVGGLNKVVHMWPYESFEERERIAAAARKTGKWPPKTHEF